ncbi:hypothetical protein TEA_006130 [Camellia sinensis var. sinensis]|uniref:Pentatricopeptide repeat-containing protein n=1 Tax=Camellia sinensis var. sinensis TaxID=542762 RepID=A0A4S4D365_CAMSN|nr:hypothetical protein TEA_006130 [Camellia sinensis var. sinensis]
MKSRICKLLLPQPISNTQRQASTIETQKSHGREIKLGISAVESHIVQSFCESKAFSDAHQLFDEMSDWDVVSATTIISRFAQHRRHKDAISLFSTMLVMNIRRNEFTFGCLKSNVYVGSAILDLYAKLSTIEEARRAFDDTHEPNVISYTTLICGYLKKEMFDDALGLFQAMPERNVVSWNAMIGGHSQTGHNEEAVNLFVEMLREGFVPSQSTFPCAMSAAANIAALGMAEVSMLVQLSSWAILACCCQFSGMRKMGEEEKP